MTNKTKAIEAIAHTMCGNCFACQECSSKTSCTLPTLASLVFNAGYRKQTTPKAYRATTDGKAAFVQEVLSPLLKQANTGWHGAEYVKGDHGEYIFLITPQGYRSNKIDISADSLESIVRDVFKNL